jgi:hypothetical protein
MTCLKSLHGSAQEAHELIPFILRRAEYCCVSLLHLLTLHACFAYSMSVGSHN